MRVTTAFSHLLRLEGVWVRDVAFGAEGVEVEVALRSRLLACPTAGIAPGPATTPGRRRPPGGTWTSARGVWR